MAARKVQLKDKSGNKAYPVTSSACVGMSDGSGSLDEKISGIISNSGYVTCTAAAGTAAKTVTQAGFALSTNCRLIVKMINYNTAASPTLNVNNTGAKPLYYNGEVASADNTWEDGETLDVYYDGANYQASNVLGGSGSGGNMILEWNTDVATTRLQVKQSQRKVGMIISYNNPDTGWVNEQYIGTVVDDVSWVNNDNWNVIKIEENVIGKNYLPGDLSHYISREFIGPNGKVVKTSAANEYRTDYIRVKKGESLVVFTKVKSDVANALSFYTQRDEDSFVEGINNIDAEHLPSFNPSFPNNFSRVDYTAEQDGYIRVSFMDFACDYEQHINSELPAIYTKEYYDDMMQEMVLYEDYESEGEPEGHFLGYINPQGYVVSNSTPTDWIIFKFVQKGCKFSGIASQNVCFAIYDEFTNQQYISKVISSDSSKIAKLEFTADKNTWVLISHSNAIGTSEYEGKMLPYISIKGKLAQIQEETEEVKDTAISNISLQDIDGVEDHSLPNLFDKNSIRTYDSDFADKVFEKIGRRTDSTGCYSNSIECKEGDWFTRNDFGTGIVVALDSNGNILGDVANAAYQPTVQITPSDPEKYDFSTATHVVFVVMLENLDSEKIVKAKYVPSNEGNYVTIPTLRVEQKNVPQDLDIFFKSKSGRYYSLVVDDSGEAPVLSIIQQEGISMSELPNDFPTFKATGNFSDYYDSLVLCPIEGGVQNYLYELTPTGLVKRYVKAKLNCPRILKEGDTWYYYGVNGSSNSSSGKLNIYKANGETFELVKGNIGNSKGENLEPHDCLVISVSPLHYICQRYVPNMTTVVSGESKIVNALHVEEVYEGKSVWEWHSENYPELWTDSHVQGNNADYLHNNTICLDPDGNLCLNNKQANQILVIERTWNDSQHTGTIGSILWKIGGNSTHSGWDVPTRIKTNAQQQWYESHDACVNASGLWTMYDNKVSGASRILEFTVDTGAKVLTNFKQHVWNQYRGRYMGSVDKCAEGVYLVSWGSSRSGNAANAGIYDFNTNKAIFEIRFDATGSSAYRVYGIKKGES